MLALADPAYTGKGLVGASYGSPPWQGVAALTMAVDSLSTGTKLENVIDVGYPFLKQDQIKICENGTIEEMKNGCNAFSSPRISAGFMADWYDPKWTPNI